MMSIKKFFVVRMLSLMLIGTVLFTFLPSNSVFAHEQDMTQCETSGIIDTAGESDARKTVEGDIATIGEVEEKNNERSTLETETESVNSEQEI